MSEEQCQKATKMDTCCCKVKIDQLQETLESLQLYMQERENDMQVWKKIVQKLCLQKFDFDIENEVIAESGRLGCKQGNGSLILPPPNPLLRGKVLKFLKVQDGLAIPDNLSKDAASKILNKNKPFRSDKANIRRKVSTQKGSFRVKVSSRILGNVQLNTGIQNTNDDIQMENEELMDDSLPNAESVFEEVTSLGLGVEVEPQTTRNQKLKNRLTTTPPAHIFDDLDTVNEEVLDVAPVTIPPVIVTNLVDSCAPEVIVLPTSATLECGTTKSIQCGLPNKRCASVPNPDVRSPSSGMNNSASTDDCIVSRIPNSFIHQEITIAPVSYNSKAVSNSQNIWPNILRKRKSNYESSSSKSSSKRADINLDDEASWRKWAPDLDEGHVDPSSCSNAQNTATNSYNSVNLNDDKRIQLENFGMSVPLTENAGYNVDRNYLNTRTRNRNESRNGITENTNRTTTVSSLSKSQENTDRSDILKSETTINTSDFSESASTASSHDDDEIENTDIHKAVDFEIIDLDSDSSDDTHELYTNRALKDHLEANEILSMEDSSDMSQDIPSVQSVDSTEDSEESRQQQIEMFANEDFVNRALKTHGFRNKLLLSAVINWQRALPEQDKEAVEVKRKAAKNVIVLDGQKKIYRCSVCEASLTNSYDRALKHAQSHFVKRSYKCGICEYKSSCRTTFLDHYKKPEYLDCFTLLACDIYDKNDFAGERESRLTFKRRKSKPKLVDLKKLRNCKKLKYETLVKIVRCPLTDTFGLQYAELEKKLKAINDELEALSKLEPAVS